MSRAKTSEAPPEQPPISETGAQSPTPASPSIDLPRELFEPRRDGSAVLHLGGGVDLELPVLTIGHLRRIFALDDELPLVGGRDGDPLRHAHWLAQVADIVGQEMAVDALPAWTLNARVRMALVSHWLRVPFDSAPSGGRSTPMM